MESNLILIDDGKYYMINSKDELIKYFLGNNYYELSKEEQIEKRKISLKFILNNIQYSIIDNKSIESIIDENNINLMNDDIYILCMLLGDKYILLEKKDVEIFTKNLDKTHIQDNYIIVNKFSRELLKYYSK